MNDPSPTEQTTPHEITWRVILLGAVLAIVLAGANAYLGLKVGMTVSASIPAAVLSMGIFRLLRKGSILENNQVQTAASAGEALAAGAIFTLPALILLDQWNGFPYVPTTAILILGGLFGVAFSIPIRRVLVKDARLRFPEGVATAEVLRAGHQTESSIKALALGGAVAFTIKVAQTGLKVLAGATTGGVTVGRAAFAVGIDLSVAMLAVGAILGFRVAVLVFAGGFIAWGIAIPWWTTLHGMPDTAGNVYQTAHGVWSAHVRYMGVGAMVIGGIWSILSMAKPIVNGLRASMTSGDDDSEHDTPFPVLATSLVILAVPLYFIYRSILPVEAGLLVLLLVMILAYLGGLIFSSVAGYMAGLVGSSHNPVSGVTIATILGTSLVLLILLGDVSSTSAAAATAIMVGAVVCCAAAISGDNLQDLKAGHLLGATPWKQQGMQVMGVFAGGLVLGPVLTLLYRAYGIGDSLPRAGMNPDDALAAPQATLMKAVSHGVFERDLPWSMIVIGMAIAVAVIVLDCFLLARKSGFRVPVLAVAVGIYIPIKLSMPMVIGGALASLATRHIKKSSGTRGLLLASGLIAGEALAGITLAIPFAIARRTDVIAISPKGFAGTAEILGILAFLGTGYWLYRNYRQPKI